MRRTDAARMDARTRAAHLGRAPRAATPATPSHGEHRDQHGVHGDDVRTSTLAIALRSHDHPGLTVEHPLSEAPRWVRSPGRLRSNAANTATTTTLATTTTSARPPR